MEKNWNFDEVIDRTGTDAVKWEPDVLLNVFGKDGRNLLPMWVADMDFKCPEPVTKALIERAEHPVYGYTRVGSAYFDALIRWYEKRHNWSISESWILTTPGVVPAVNYVIQRFSKPGDKILIQSPVYYPFARSIKNNGRQVLDNPLKIENNHYKMDFKDLEKKLKDPRVKLAILCSPHNPVGRVWTRHELETFGNLCIKNNVLVFSDEIHCDLVMPGFRHICFASVADEFAENSITALAASKTFNLAGLQHSALVIPEAKIREQMRIFLENAGFSGAEGGTLFGAVAATAAYNEAEPWLDALINYLHENFRFLKENLEKNLPEIRVFELQGTYLAWVDFTALENNEERRISIIEQKAKIALDHGLWFGTDGAGFERFNLACPRSMLEKAVKAIIAAFKKDIA